MSVERTYYDNEALWDWGNVRSEDLARIQAVAERVPPEVESLLDVGCGNGLFVNYLLDSPRPFKDLHAADRSEVALQHVRTASTPASIDDLPFSDASFDIVTCLEVIEHLPTPVFGRGLAELCRVSAQWVLISVPYKQDLQSGFVACPACRSLFHPYRHVRSFDDSKLIALLSEHGFRCEALYGIGSQRTLRFMKAYQRLRRAQSPGENPYAFPIPCPICESLLPARAIEIRSEIKVDRRLIRSAKTLVKSFWPAEVCASWMMALYKKRASDSVGP